RHKLQHARRFHLRRCGGGGGRRWKRRACWSLGRGGIRGGRGGGGEGGGGGEVGASGVLGFGAGRHPVVERRMEESGGGRFVPNSISLEAWLGGGGSAARQKTLSHQAGKDGAPSG